jgi:hypothetical protein
VRERLATRHAVVAMQAEEPVGADALRALCACPNVDAAA